MSLSSHDFATKLRRRGVGLDVIAQLLGHTTLAMTQRYAHIGLESLRDAVATLDAVATPTSLEETSTEGGETTKFARLLHLTPRDDSR